MTTKEPASCEAAHVHYVSVSAGLWLEYIKDPGGQGSASSQTDDPADWLTFVGSNSWGEVVADWTGQRRDGGVGGGV